MKENTGRHLIMKNESSYIPKVIYGRELIINLYGCNLKIISNGEKIKQFAKELCEVIDMKPYGKPYVPYFGLKKENTKGYSLLQFIETSSITGHFSESEKAAYINIFSCQDFDVDKAKSFTKDFFEAKDMQHWFIVRH
jgi:S-adenosylmethionine decarboxylase